MTIKQDTPPTIVGYLEWELRGRRAVYSDETFVLDLIEDDGELSEALTPGDYMDANDVDVDWSPT